MVAGCRRWSCLLAVVLWTGVWAPVQAQAPKKVVTVEGITEYRLDNGLVVLLFPDASRPTVTVNMTIFVGSRHEGYGETGMAHLLEHMLFKGTPNHGNIITQLSERGARFNGTTWLDRTNYYETLEANDDNLEFAIRLEADRMVNSYVKREDLLSEMTVVRNEFEMGENSPTNILSQRVAAVAYEWHNYGKSTIGNRSDIERVPIDRLQEFYHKYYRPDNAMVVVAGKFDEKKALTYLQEYFGALSRPKSRMDPTYTEEPPQDGERNVALRRVGEVGAVAVAYHIPAGPHADFAAIEVLEDILTARPAGLLYKALVESKMATSIRGSAYALHDPGLLEFMAEVRRENSLEDVRDTIFDVLKTVAEKGVTEEQVQRSIQRFTSLRERAAANSTRIAVQLSEWAAQGDWRLYFLHRDRVEKVTGKDVQRVAATYLVPSNRTVGMFIPTEKPKRVAIAATKDVDSLVADYKGRAEIAKGEEFDPSPSNIDSRTEHRTLPGGLKVALLEKKTRGETVVVQLSLRYGDENSLKGLTSAAEFLPTLMTRGTKQLTRQQLQDELDKNQASLNGSAGPPGLISFSVQTKREFLPNVLELLRQVLREPSLPAEELDILKRQQLAQLEQQKTEPFGLAPIFVQRKLSPYPKDDVRYVPTIDEQIERVGAVTLEQLNRLYREYLGARAGELVIVGDFDASQTMQLLEDALADWKPRLSYARVPRAAPQGLKGESHSIETPDKANSLYFAGLVIPMSDTHPDYPALVMACHLLGGDASSRLFERVRQKEGLSYGARAGFNAHPIDQRASLTIFAIANPANIPKVVAAISEEIERLREEPISESELIRAKQGYLRQAMLSRTQDRSLAQALGNNLFVDRNMAHQAELEEKIDALAPNEVSAAFKKYIDPSKLIIATAGDFAGAESADKPNKKTEKR